MAYVNPYKDTMNYEPSTLWTQPERPRTDWSTFWGTPEEDDDDNGDENGYEPEGPESQVVTGSDAKLKSLWGDVMADMQKNVQGLFGSGTTSSGVYPGWPAGDNTQAQQVYNAGDLNAVTTGISTPDTQGTALQAYQPSYNQQQQDLIDQSTQAYNQQQQDYMQNGPMQTGFVTDIPDWRDMAGPGGLTANQSAQSYANAPTTTYGNTGATNPTIGEILNADIEDEDIDFEDKDWGDFW